MEVLSAPGKDAVYFAFTPTLRGGGRLADFSQVPGDTASTAWPSPGTRG